MPRNRSGVEAKLQMFQMDTTSHAGSARLAPAAARKPGLGDPLTLNLVTKKYGGSNFRTIFKQAPNLGNGTNNATPFNFLK